MVFSRSRAAILGPLGVLSVLCLPLLGLERSALDPLAQGLSPRERLNILVDRVKFEQSEIRSMRARFVQNQTSVLLLEPETSLGRFLYHSPDRVVWEYEEPSPVILAINEHEIVTYFPDQQRAKVAAVSTYSEQVMQYLGARGSLETLMKYFAVTAEFPEAHGDPYHLLLQPKYSRIKKRIRSMEMWLDHDTFLPSRLEYTFPNGDRTGYQFVDVEINVDLPPESFELDLPEDVEVESIDLKRRD